MDHNNYIFPTKLSAAKYVIKNPERIEYVQYNTLAPTSLFPKLENISRFGSFQEAQRFVRDFGNSEEVFRFDESEVLHNNEAYIVLGWLFNPMTGVWRIDQDKYHRVMGTIAYKLRPNAAEPLSKRFPTNFASGGGRLSAASGGGGVPSIFASSGGGVASGGGRLSSVRGLESNINDILTGFDERKLRIIDVQAHVLSSGGNRLIVKTDNIINKLSAVIAEDGIREWTARKKSHAISRRDEIKKLKGEKGDLLARRDEKQREQLNPRLSVENKFDLVHELEQISGEIIRRDQEIGELSSEELPPYTFNDIDREIHSLASDILESSRYISSEEAKLGGIKLSYAERVQGCSGIGIFISDFDERIKHISLMSASYKAPEYYLEERRNVIKKEIEKRIALLDLWRLSITYSNTQPGIILSQLDMYEPMEDLTALAEYNQGYRKDLYQGALLHHGYGAGVELLRRASTTLRASATRALEGLAQVIEAQSEGQGPHSAVVSEITPVVQEAGGIVIKTLQNISRILSRRRTGGNFTRRRLVVPRNRPFSSGAPASPRRNRGNSIKRRRRLTPPESNNSANAGSANSGRSNGGGANAGRANAGSIPLQQAMNRGSLEDLLEAGEAYNGNLPEVPPSLGVNEFGIPLGSSANFGVNESGRPYAGRNAQDNPYLYSSLNAMAANQQRRRTSNNRNLKK